MMQELVLALFQRTPADPVTPGPDGSGTARTCPAHYPGLVPDRHVGQGVCARRHQIEGSGTVRVSCRPTTWNSEPRAKVEDPTLVPAVAPGGTLMNRVVDVTCWPGQPGIHAPVPMM